MDERNVQTQNDSFEIVEFVVSFISEHPFMVVLTVAGACMGAAIDKRLGGKQNE